MVKDNNNKDKIEEIKKRPNSENDFIFGALIIGLILVFGALLVINNPFDTDTDPSDESGILNPESELDDEPYVQESIENLEARIDNISHEDINIINVKSRQWPDGCLGLGESDDACTLQIVDGYEVVLSAKNEKYTYRTNQDGSLVILEE